MFRIRRVYDDITPANQQAIAQVQDVLRAQFPMLSKREIRKLPEQLRNPMKYRFRAILFIAEGVKEHVDGFDSLIDVVSAVAVFLGIRYRRELYSTSFVIVMMFGTTGFISYEAITRLIFPETVDASALAIIAAVTSGGICYVMSIYQHFVGKRTGSLSLISQSIDSRNHAFQAAAVLMGLIFAIFDIFIVDSIVALVVAGLILKSAIELSTETVRMAEGEELDVSRFGREYETAMDKRRWSYFKTWILLTLKDVSSREHIISRYENTFATDDLPVVGHFSPMGRFGFRLQLNHLLKELVNAGQVTAEDDHYYITDKGRRTVNRKLTRGRFLYS